MQFQLGSGEILSQGQLVLQTDERWFLPVAETLNSLGFNVASDERNARVVGTLWTPDERIELTASDCVMRSESRVEKGLRNERGVCTIFLVYESTLYVDSIALGAFLNAAFEIRSYDSKLLFLSDREAPIKALIKLGTRSKRLAEPKAQNDSIPLASSAPVEAQFFGGLSLQHQIEGQFQAPPQSRFGWSGLLFADTGSWQNSAQFQLSLGSDYKNFGGSYTLLKEWNKENEKSLSPASLELFRTVSQALSYLSQSREGYGLRLRSHLNVETMSTEREIKHLTMPDWTVELYIDDQLIDIQRADTLGVVRFKETPIFFGRRKLHFVSWSPTGQRRDEYRVLEYAELTPPLDVTRYDLSLIHEANGDLNVSLFGNRSINKQAALSFAHVIKASAPSNLSSTHHSAFGFHLNTPAWLGSGTSSFYLGSDYNSHRFSAIEWRKSFPRSEFSARWANFDQGFTNDSVGFSVLGDSRLKSERELSWQQSLGPYVRLETSFINRISWEKLNLYLVDTRISTFIMPWLFQLSSSILRDERLGFDRTARLSLYRIFNRVRTSAHISFQEQEPSDLALNATFFEISKATNIGLQYDRNLIAREGTIGVNLERVFKEFGLIFYAFQGTHKNWGLSVGLTQVLDLWPNKITKVYPRVHSLSPSRAEVQFVLDSDHSNLKDIKGITLKVDGQKTNESSDKNGILNISDLPTHEKVSLTLDLESLANPYLGLEQPEYLLKTRPGSFHQIEIKLQSYGEIEGMTQLVDRPQSHVPIVLRSIDRSQPDYRTISDSTGVFLFDRVPSGIYRLSIGETESRPSDTWLVEPENFIVEVKKGGSIETGYVFILRPANEITPPNAR